MGSHFLGLTHLVVWNWITAWVFWRCIGTFGILVLDSCVGILALNWWTDRGLFLCSPLITKDHGCKI